MERRTNIEGRLRERGLRVTLPRVAVMEYLLSTPAHPTAEEVGSAVNRRVPTASRASVYNVLHSLSAAGLVEELVFEDAVARFDANLGRHHHFICRACGGVEDVPWDALPLAPRRTLPSGHAVETCSVTLKGLCPSCAGDPPRR